MDSSKREEPQWLHVVPRSYWQRGCDDARNGREPRPPSPGGFYDDENRSYYNGWHFGRRVTLSNSASINKGE